ncbi:MAG: hypothetical protein V1647_01900, partial [Pseudomonadota bacterium]
AVVIASIYWTGLLNISAKQMLFVIASIYVITGFTLVGRRSAVVYFILGIFLSGILARIFLTDGIFVAYASRICAIIFVALSVLYLSGKHYSSAVVVLICSSVFFGGSRLQLVESGYDNVGTYSMDSKKVDVLISKDQETKHYAFMENGARSMYTYPFQNEHELSFYYLLMQAAQLKSVLVMGDIPMGMADVLSKLPAYSKVHYIVPDRKAYKFWSEFISDDVLKRIKIINSRSALLPKYDLTVVFTDGVKNAGTATYIYEKQVENIGRRITNGTIAFVTTKICPAGVEPILYDTLNKRFKNVLSVKPAEGINFTIASNDPDGITTDPAKLKNKFLHSGLDVDYMKVKIFMEGGSVVISTSSTVLAGSSFSGSLYGIGFFQALAAFTFLLFLALYLVRHVKSVKRYIPSINRGVVFFLCAAFFSQILLYYQGSFSDMNRYFLLQIFMFAAGAVCAALIPSALIPAVILFVLAPVLWLVFIDYSDARWPISLFAVAAGLSLVPAFISSVRTTNYIPSGFFASGLGILFSAWCDQNHYSVLTTSYYIAFAVFSFALYEVLLRREDA